MKKVEYYGRADSVTITDEQFKAVGVESATRTWTQEERVQEVADKAADHLLERDGARFGEEGKGPARKASGTPQQAVEMPTGTGTPETTGDATSSATGNPGQ